MSEMLRPSLQAVVQVVVQVVVRAGRRAVERRRWLRLWTQGLACGVLLVVLLAVPSRAQAAPPAEAVLAGGCFWCLEHDLEQLSGVIEVESGYSGGTVDRPTYRQVSAGGTGHQESVRVRFDPDRISYARLLQAYWRQVDPFDGGGQFCDRGSSYRPVIFTRGGAQEQQARASLRAAARELRQDSRSLAVAIRPLERFWPAEDYHQNYADRHPLRYRYYRMACGRDRRLDAVWGSRARRGEAWVQD